MLLTIETSRFLVPGKNSTGEMLETRQLVYITDSSDKLFLSREACSALGIITDSFPRIGETTTDIDVSTNLVGSNVIQNTICECPKRELPPPMPTTLPFPATEEHRADLQQYILDRYKSSTFNTCEHQPLPLMSGPPMQQMVDTTATPVAHHTPVPVPLHWQDEVKAGLLLLFFQSSGIACNQFVFSYRYFCGGSFCFMSWCLKYFCAVGALCMFAYF